MRERLGSAFPQEACDWWAKFMGRTAVPTQIGWMSTLAYADITADVPRITCPTLVITTEASPLASVAENRAWQELIPASKLLVLPGDACHVAVTQPHRCPEATLEFIQSSPVYKPR
jgi:3-oxoadipate enol-lactonase